MKKILIGGRDNSYKNYTAALDALNIPWEISPACPDITGFSGLLLPGGGDIDPSFYHEDNSGSKDMDKKLDQEQLDLLAAFVLAKKPVLGICRGHQVINVFFGGTLIQHMDTWQLHRLEKGDAVHKISVVPGSYLHKLYGSADFSVNSCHHQAVKETGDGLIPIAYAPDGTVEAMIHESLPILSVQWHPERMAFALTRPDTVHGEGIFTYFLSLCHLLPKR